MSYRDAPAVRTLHDVRVNFLDSLAVLAGCGEQWGAALPDGTRPDVFRADSSRHILFLGDAKNTEGPGNLATQARLNAYFSWLGGHVRNGGVGVFAICAGSGCDIRGWVSTLSMLGHEAAMTCERWRVDRFMPDTVVLIMTFVDAAREPSPAEA